MSKIFLSVVIPAYNEAKNFRDGVLGPVIAYLAKQNYSWEALFVDDGSTDETNNLLADFCKKNKGCKVLKISHGGKSAAVTAGVLAAQGEIVLFTDFDQSTPLDQIEKFIVVHQNGAEVVIGIRDKTYNDTWVRKLRSWMFVTLVQMIALPGIRDTQCGFKSFKREAARRIFTNLQVSRSVGKVTGGYMGAFDVEVLFIARKLGYRIEQVSVDWVKVFSEKLNIWKEPLMMLRDTLKVRLYAILGKYDGL